GFQLGGGCDLTVAISRSSAPEHDFDPHLLNRAKAPTIWLAWTSWQQVQSEKDFGNRQQPFAESIVLGDRYHTACRPPNSTVNRWQKSCDFSETVIRSFLKPPRRASS